MVKKLKNRKYLFNTSIIYKLREDSKAYLIKKTVIIFQDRLTNDKSPVWKKQTENPETSKIAKLRFVGTDSENYIFENMQQEKFYISGYFIKSFAKHYFEWSLPKEYFSDIFSEYDNKF